MKQMHKDTKVKRRELKYYISYSEYKILAHKLKKVLNMDKHCKGKPYFIRSLYFDTFNDKSLFEKMAGIEKRKKYRIRTYDTKGSVIKFEIKNKTNNSILKESAFITKEDAIQLQKGNLDILLKYNNPILNKVYVEFKKYPYHPVVLIDYLREAYTYDINNIRITFDQLIKSRSSNIDLFGKDLYLRPFLRSSMVVLEIKYDHTIPLWIRQLFQIPYFKRSAISKYALSRLTTG
jgi:hypothetical protein